MDEELLQKSVLIVGTGGIGTTGKVVREEEEGEEKRRDLSPYRSDGEGEEEEKGRNVKRWEKQEVSADSED